MSVPLSVLEEITNKLQSLASTKTVCDGCNIVIGERYARWPSHTIELAADPKKKGKVKANALDTVSDTPTAIKAEEFVPLKTFHFCSEDCLREYLNKRN